jgi:polysaccharide pyruvyl transferase CsaB
MAKLQAVLCGYYGMGNGGDEALLATLLQMLPRHVTPLVLSGNPAQTRDRYQVDAIQRRDMRAIWQALRRSQVFIWGGGSLIQDATSALSPLYYAGLMQLAQRMGLTTIAWAQGVGPLTRPLTRWIARHTLAGCTAVSVRDRGSADCLLEWGVPATLAPDPVWAMKSTPMTELSDLPVPRVAVNFRSHPSLTPSRLATLTQALINFQTATQTYILLVPFQATQDLAIAAAIQPQLPGASQIVQLDDPTQLKGVFQGVEMAIAMRFHGLIMAAAERCRCVALSYDPKVSQLMDALAIPGWELADTPTDAETICQTWLEHYAKGGPLSTPQLQSLVDRALIHQELLHTILPMSSTVPRPT